MKKIVILISILCMCNVAVFSQGNEMDAYTMTNTELNGTARSMAMGGAFGALGGDLSIISINPAGLGIYRSSEISGTLGFSTVNASTKWYGTGKDANKISCSPDNIGFELYLPTGLDNLLNWNVAFSYNRLKNFSREIKMENRGMNNSIGDYIAAYSKGTPESSLIYESGIYDPYNNPNLGGRWLTVLGYESYMINPKANNTYTGFFDDYKPTSGYLRLTESGHIDDMNFGAGMNISNLFFLGASLSATSIDYKLNSGYEEYNQLEDHIYLDNRLNSKGEGYSFTLGVITNLQVLRLGVAYTTPKWFEMTDYYDGVASTYLQGEEKDFVRATPENSYSEYKFQTPDKWTFSGAIIVGHTALISADYELTNYKNMKYRDMKNRELETNRDIRADFDYSHTLRLGAEFKVTPQFAVRAGYSTQTLPVRTELVNNQVEVLPSGTIPHFTVPSTATNYYTAGLGYRFTPNFYMDLACIYRVNEAKAYAFSTIPALPESSARPTILSESASLTNKSTRLALTLGYRF